MRDLKKEDIKKIMAASGWSRFTLIFMLVVLLWNSSQIWWMSSTVGKVDKYNQGLVDEIGGIRGDVKNFADDLNEIRRFLLLPEKNYSVDGVAMEKTDTGEQKNSDNTVAVFAFLNSLAQEDKLAKNQQTAQPVFSNLFSNADFLAKLAQSQIQIGVKGDLQVKFLDGTAALADGKKNELFGQPLYNLVFDAAANEFRLQSALGEKTYADFNAAGFVDQLAADMVNNLEQLRAKKIQAGQDALKQDEAAKKAAEDQLDAQKLELDNIIKDKAFTDTLQGLGLKVTAQPREEANRYIYDVLDAGGKVKFSLIMELSSGMLKVLKDNQETDIKTFLDDGSKKKT